MKNQINLFRIACFIMITGFMVMGDKTNAQTPTIVINGDTVSASDMAKFPYWLNAGSTIAVGKKVISISVIEYTIASATGGGKDLLFDSIIYLFQT